jgi:hypothetical protein
MCRNTFRRTSLADRNEFRSLRGGHASGSVQPRLLGSTAVRTAINAQSPSACSRRMRAGTPAHPGCAWFSHAACRSKRCERHSPRRQASPCIAEGFSPTVCGAYQIKRSISFRSLRGMRDSGSVQPPKTHQPSRLRRQRKGAMCFITSSLRAVSVGRLPWNGGRGAVMTPPVQVFDHALSFCSPMRSSLVVRQERCAVQSA